MKSEKVAAVAHTLKEVADAALPFGTKDPRAAVQRVHDNVSYALDQVSQDALAALTHELLNTARLSAKFSEEYVGRRINRILSELLTGASQDDAAAAVQQIFTDFESLHDEQQVYLPIEGISLESGPVTIGNIRLLRVEDAFLNALSDQADSVVAGTTETEERKQMHKTDMRQQLRERLFGRVVSEYRVVAEPERARERATEETRRALELLRFGIPALYSRDQSVQIGLPGEVARGVRDHVSLSPTSVGWGMRAGGAKASLALTADHLEHLRSIGVFELSALLSQSDRASQFQLTVLNAVHWFSTAQTQVELENGFLALVTCIESLLTPHDGSPIGTAIAEGIAIILGNTVDDRISLKKRVKMLYSKRSAVSHGGAKAILDREYSELEQIAAVLLINLVARTREFSTQKDLASWIEQQKFSGGLPLAPSAAD